MAHFNDGELQGYLERKPSSKLLPKTKMWCTLSDKQFTFSKNKKINSGGTVDLCSVQTVRKLSSRKSTKEFEVVTDERTYTFMAATTDLCDQWITRLQQALPAQEKEMQSEESAESGDAKKAEECNPAERVSTDETTVPIVTEVATQLPKVDERKGEPVYAVINKSKKLKDHPRTDKVESVQTNKDSTVEINSEPNISDKQLVNKVEVQNSSTANETDEDAPREREKINCIEFADAPEFGEYSTIEESGGYSRSGECVRQDDQCAVPRGHVYYCIDKEGQETLISNGGSVQLEANDDSSLNCLHHNSNVTSALRFGEDVSSPEPHTVLSPRRMIEQCGAQVSNCQFDDDYAEIEDKTDKTKARLSFQGYSSAETLNGISPVCQHNTDKTSVPGVMQGAGMRDTEHEEVGEKDGEQSCDANPRNSPEFTQLIVENTYSNVEIDSPVISPDDIEVYQNVMGDGDEEPVVLGRASKTIVTDDSKFFSDNVGKLNTGANPVEIKEQPIYSRITPTVKGNARPDKCTVETSCRSFTELKSFLKQHHVKSDREQSANSIRELKGLLSGLR